MPTTVFNQAITNDGGSNTGVSKRVEVPVTGSGLGQVRITVQAPSGHSVVASHVAIAIVGSATAPNTQNTPTELKFSGASGCNIPTGTQVDSDWVDFSDAFANGDHLIVVFDMTGDNVSYEFVPGANAWSGSATTSWNVANVGGGFSSGINFLVNVTKIETQAAAGSTGSGAAAAQSATASGAGLSVSIGTGAPAAQAAAASGAGLSVSTGTGAPAAQSAAASGAGLSVSTGSGTPASQSAAVSGAGVSAWNATGAPASQSAAVSGAGISESTGSGAAAAQPATVSGSDNILGTGTPAAQSATASGAGLSVSTGSGAVAAQAAAVSGDALSRSTGTGAPAAQSAAASGAGLVVSPSVGSTLSDLPEETAMADDEFLYAVIGGNSRKITKINVLEATLAALAALDGTAGLLTQTGASTFERRSLAASTGLLVTNPAGTLANPNVALDVSALSEDTSPDSSADFLLTYDASGAAHRKVKPQNVNNTIGYFYVTKPAGQSFSQNAFVKVTLNNEIEDTNGWYDNATNFRYTPLVAGDYYFYWQCYIFGGVPGSSYIPIMTRIHKNGTSIANGGMIRCAVAAAISEIQAQVTAVVPMNGSTDYIEFVIYSELSTPQVVNTVSNTYALGYRLKA